jgi:tetratricopeptide (TPR) repeat protein
MSIAMDDQQYIDIGDFIKGNYNEEQQKLFEQKIVDDPLFAEEVAHYISTVAIAKQLKEEDRKKQFKALYHQQQLEKKAKIRTIRKWVVPVSIAASLIIMVTGYYTLFQNKPGSGSIADNKSRNEQGKLAGKKGDSTGIASNTGVDSAVKGAAKKHEALKKEPGKAEQQQLYAQLFVPDALPEDKEGPLEDAFAYYESKEYKEAAAAFEKADLNTATREPEEERTVFYAYYYKALSYMANNNAGKAIPELNKAMQVSTDNLSAIKTKWYLSLAYLQTGNLKKTASLLVEIAGNRYETAYKAKAAALLKDLEQK